MCVQIKSIVTLEWRRDLHEQLFPSLLPNYHAHTDRQAADGGTRCVHEEIQFGNETNVLRRGGDVAAPQEEEEEEEEEEEVHAASSFEPTTKRRRSSWLRGLAFASPSIDALGEHS
ncbi:hypothetical protein EYF80_035271 [Liparis tanakae]|uniref:Uncharacterized protein n=1 Tax=Liparis tanakae TaxID=230148 RepID=A0A4Z2GLV8_9TELE|nr:hypothetical protein EYF80_035271 [Liparis tanakae]